MLLITMMIIIVIRFIGILLYHLYFHMSGDSTPAVVSWMKVRATGQLYVGLE